MQSIKRNQTLVVILVIMSVLGIDQGIKIWVKTHMYMHESIHITDWWYILFTENPGMAFGMELVDKFALTSFRIVAVCWLIWYIQKIIRRGTDWPYLLCLSFITAGAAGNIIDCLFYGLIFNNPPAPLLAELVPWGTGYGQLFYGRVVDMFYFPLFEWDWPDSFPIIGGQHNIFFSPVFNFADASISCGVAALLIFCRRHLSNAK